MNGGVIILKLPISMKPRNSQPKSYAQVDNNAPKMIIPTVYISLQN